MGVDVSVLGLSVGVDAAEVAGVGIGLDVAVVVGVLAWLPMKGEIVVFAIRVRVEVESSTAVVTAEKAGSNLLTRSSSFSMSSAWLLIF